MSFKPRYILAEEAEERIVALYRKERGDAAEIFNTAIDACQSIILDMYDNAPAEVEPVKHGRWIPVSERFPEEDTEVLISYRYKEGEGNTSHVDIDITTYGQMYFGGNKVGNNKHWRAPFEYFYSNYEVIAWMPLPEPYKGEGDDKHEG